METSTFSKPSNMDGTQGIESGGTGVKVANPKTVRSSDFFLRFLALITSLVAIIVLATSKETKIVPVVLIPNLPAINVQVTAKWQYVQAFVFFMVINIIACVYAAISLVLSIAGRAGSKGLWLMLIIFDLVIVALLFSANGAAAAVGMIGMHGNSHLRWNKICDVFDSNCRRVVASIVVSTIGASVFLLLILLTVVNLQKKSH